MILRKEVLFGRISCCIKNCTTENHVSANYLFTVTFFVIFIFFPKKAIHYNPEQDSITSEAMTENITSHLLSTFLLWQLSKNISYESQDHLWFLDQEKCILLSPLNHWLRKMYCSTRLGYSDQISR